MCRKLRQPLQRNERGKYENGFIQHFQIVSPYLYSLDINPMEAKDRLLPLRKNRPKVAPADNIK